MVVSICSLMTSDCLVFVGANYTCRQVHVCDLLISYNHSPILVRLRLFILVVYLPAELDRNTTGQRIRSRAAAHIGSGNETAMEVTLATLVVTHILQGRR